MQASNVCTPTVDHFGTILVAIELSRQSWLVTMHSPDRDRISRHKLCGGDHAGLLALIERVQERAARALGSVPAVVSCYEAGYDGFWLHRRLMAGGLPTTCSIRPVLQWNSGLDGRRRTASMASFCCAR